MKYDPMPEAIARHLRFLTRPVAKPEPARQPIDPEVLRMLQASMHHNR